MSEHLEPELTAHNAPAMTTSDLSAFAADAEMVAEFVTESREHLAEVEAGLLLIEKDSTDLESVNAVFRAVHTIKGLAGFLELQAIQDIAHEVETLLDHARSRRLVLTPPLVDALFEGIDYIRVQVDGVHLHLSGGPAPPAAAKPALMLHLRDIGSDAAADQGANRPENGKANVPEQPERAEGALSAATAAVAAPPPSSPSAKDGPKAVAAPERAAWPASGERRRAPAASATAPQSDDLSLRVETSKLDDLMNAVGELVIAQTLVTHNPQIGGIKDPRLIADLALLARVTAEVQRVTTSMRMVPIGNQFQKTARVVRYLSRQLGKKIALITSGEDTELDKTVAEALSDPLMHMVRNSIDHGIEPQDQRARAGKNPVAQIRLAAYHQSTQIVIEISDDGRGLDRERILAKAAERGLIAPGARFSDAETFQLIFEPGFSTAEKVTDISGRGVGMDVVRKHVQKLRGRIDIQSEAGTGTTFFLRLPLTLALIEGMVVAVGDNRYILPLYSVSEIFCPSAAQLAPVNGTGETVTLRGAKLPVVRLHRRFGVAPDSEQLTDGVLIVTEAEGKRFCLFVDRMLGKQDLVIKSLGDAFKGSTGLMGCAILADGRIGLILDVGGIMP